jgi:hypothetical protein
MAKRLEEELEKKLILLFKGDFKALGEILGKRMTPTEFIRRSVRRSIEKAYAKREAIAMETSDVNLE